MTETEARAAITVEHTRGYYDAGGHWHAPDWELRTPDGWCWEPDRHTNLCFSAEQAKKERTSEPIMRCEADCAVCGFESTALND
jgi:hypothetical protein